MENTRLIFDLRKNITEIRYKNGKISFAIDIIRCGWASERLQIISMQMPQRKGIEHLEQVSHCMTKIPFSTFVHYVFLRKNY